MAEQRKTTDELKALAREVFAEERQSIEAQINANLPATIEAALTACLDKAGIMTKPQVEAVVDARLKPFQTEIEQAKALQDDLATIQQQVDSIREGITQFNVLSARLTGVLNIIEEWPQDHRRMQDQHDLVEGRITTAEGLLKDLGHSVNMATASAINVQRKVLGDPNHPDEPSMLKDWRNGVANLEKDSQLRHDEVVDSIKQVSETVTSLVPQVQANTRFRENRLRIEHAVRSSVGGALKLSRAFVGQHKRTILGSALAAVITALGGLLLSLVTDPSFQQLIRDLLAGDL